MVLVLWMSVCLLRVISLSKVILSEVGVSLYGVVIVFRVMWCWEEYSLDHWVIRVSIDLGVHTSLFDRSQSYSVFMYFSMYQTVFCGFGCLVEMLMTSSYDNMCVFGLSGAVMSCMKRFMSKDR